MFGIMCVMQDREILSKLALFDLTEYESQIYVFLVGKEAQSILDVSRVLGIPRTSVYDGVESLIAKGLLEKVILYKTQKVKAAPVEMLETLIDEKRKQIDDLEQTYQDIKQGLKVPMGQTLPQTQIRYYHGEQGIRQMLWNMLSAKSGVVGYSQFGREKVTGKKFFDRLQEELKTRKIMDRVISNPDPDRIEYLNSIFDFENNDLQVSLFDVRFVDREVLPIDGDTSIYNDTYASFYWQDGELVGFEIDNRQFVDLQRKMFEVMWGRGRKY